MIGEPWVLALGAAFLFGLALALTPLGLRHLSPLRGATISIPAATAVLAALSAGSLAFGTADLRGVAIFAAVGALFPAVVTLLTFDANRRLGPNVTAALGNLAPLFAIAIAVLGEDLAPRAAFAIALIVVGAIALTFERDGSMPWTWWALGLPLAAAAIRGAAQPLTKLGLEHWPDPLAAALIGYAMSSAVIVAAGLVRGRDRPGGYSRRGVLWFAAVGLCNGGAVLCMYAALMRGSVATVAPLVATYPLATLALSAMVAREVRVGPRLAAGVIATVLGVVLLIRA